MNIIGILVLALGLALDAFAVSVASGIVVRRRLLPHALRVALYFGGFQGLMPLIGWLAGLGMRSFVTGFGHWIAFGLLFLVGSKMIYSAIRLEEMEKNSGLNTPALLLLSLATSVDALVVGVSFSVVGIEVLVPAAIIGLVTFISSFGGMLLGNRFGHFFENRIEAIGGIVLILMGLKMLLSGLLS